MFYQRIFTAMKAAADQVQHPIQTLELVDGETVTLIEVGLAIEGFDFYPVRIEDLGCGCFRVYAVDSSGVVFLLEEIVASTSTTIHKTFFKNEREIAEALFHKFVVEGSTDVKFLQRISTWVSRDDAGYVVVPVEQSEIEHLINRNEGHFAIVCKDAHDREYKQERFVTGNLFSDREALAKVAELNKVAETNATGNFYEVVKLPYKLYTPDY